MNHVFFAIIFNSLNKNSRPVLPPHDVPLCFQIRRQISDGCEIAIYLSASHSGAPPFKSTHMPSRE